MKTFNASKIGWSGGFESIREELERFEQKVDKKVCKEIDAGACGTSFDHRRAEEARDEMEQQKDILLAKIAAVCIELDALRAKAGYIDVTAKVERCWEEFDN
jgi:hypothetical protein